MTDRCVSVLSVLSITLLMCLLLSSQVSDVAVSFLGDESGLSHQNHPGPAEGESTGWSPHYYVSHPVLSRPTNPRVAVDGSTVHVVWEDLRLLSQGGGPEIFYRRGDDDGKTWSEETMISDNDSVISFQPQIAADKDNVYVVWDDRRGASLCEVYYTNSSDGGATWSENKPLTSNDGHTSENAYVAIEGNAIYTVWSDERDGQYEIYYKNSTDGGVTWSNETRLTYWASGTDGPAAIDVDGSNVHLLFTRYTGSWEAFYMKSEDGGLTWTSPVDLGNLDGYNSWASDLYSSGSSVHTCLVDARTGAYQIFYRNSTDNGTTWNPLMRISNSTLEASQCSLAGDSETIHAVWYDFKPDNTEIYCRNSTTSGLDWNQEIRLTSTSGDSLQPDIGVIGSVVHVTWLELTYGGHVLYRRNPDFLPETVPPTAPALVSASLMNDSRDVRVSWSMAEDEGLVGGTSWYVVNRAEYMEGPYSSVAEVNTSGSPTYTWTDVGAGEGDPKDYFYRVESVDRSNNTNWSRKAAKLSFHLNQGKHLVSIPLVQEDESASVVLQTLSYDVAWSYDSLNGKWEKYSPFRNYNDLLEIDHRMGFWVNVTRESNLTVAGLVPTVTVINLSAGWNLVSFPSFNSSHTVSHLKAEVGAKRVEGFNPSLPPFHLRVLGEAEVLQTGEAYWVKIDVGADWIIEVS